MWNIFIYIIEKWHLIYLCLILCFLATGRWEVPSTLMMLMWGWWVILWLQTASICRMEAVHHHQVHHWNQSSLTPRIQCCVYSFLCPCFMRRGGYCYERWDCRMPPLPPCTSVYLLGIIKLNAECRSLIR